MSGKRVPLSSNQNALNSPLRAASTANASMAKGKRSLAQLQRDEQYGQPPPAKKQATEQQHNGSQQQHSLQPRGVKPQQVVLQQRKTASTQDSRIARERTGALQQRHQTQQHNHETEAKYSAADIEEIRAWQKHHKARFPKMVFFFEHIPEDMRLKLAKQIASLGAREEKFFSINITHVITTRQIPSEKSVEQYLASLERAEPEQDHDQQTINPAMLQKTEGSKPEISVKRKLFEAELGRTRQMRAQTQEDVPKRPRRNMDILIRAREMNKKIWSLEKLQRMLSLLLEPDPHVSAAIAYGSRSKSTQAHEPKPSEDRNLLRLLHNERINGPSDRDPTVVARELHHFRGFYIYIYDMDEKQKPIMVREYEKVADKSDGDWPQFRTAPLGRCPFVEDYESREPRREPKPQPKLKAESTAKRALEARPVIQPPEVPPMKPITGKRTLREMESGHSRNSSVASTDFINPPRPGSGNDGRPNAFTSRAAGGRLFGGEPVASGLQPSNMTSAIRSQMISSTAATPGVITGLSKEVHGLQRQVFKRNNSNTSQDLSSRRTNELNFKEEEYAGKRPSTLGRTSSRRVELMEDTAPNKSCAQDDTKSATQAQAAAQRKAITKPKKPDPKPGYCENCMEKYEDFDEHIVSRKHRRFADDSRNWTELDDLLSQLERMPRARPFSFSPPAFDAGTDYDEC